MSFTASCARARTVPFTWGQLSASVMPALLKVPLQAQPLTTSPMVAGLPSSQGSPLFRFAR